ncbi:MAG: sterol desaturase family protein [Myxococcota bacterium]
MTRTSETAASYLLFPIVVGASLSVGLAVAGTGAERVVGAAIVLSTALIVAVFERLLPFEPQWNVSRDDVKPDLWHAVVSNLAAPPIYQAAWVALIAPLTAFVGFNVWPTSLPLLAQLVLALVIGELGQYWAHRLSHERDALWRLHSTHHSPHRLYWLNAARDHPFGVALLFSAELIPLLALGVTEEVLVLFALFTAVHGLFQHANVNVRLGPLNWVFSMAELHRWHHSKHLDEANNNYGANLIVWDIVFGTRFLPPRRPPSDVGIGNMPTFPTTYLGQLAVPFRWRGLADPTADPPGASDRLVCDPDSRAE